MSIYYLFLINNKLISKIIIYIYIILRCLRLIQVKNMMKLWL